MNCDADLKISFFYLQTILDKFEFAELKRRVERGAFLHQAILHTYNNLFALLIKNQGWELLHAEEIMTEDEILFEILYCR